MNNLINLKIEFFTLLILISVVLKSQDIPIFSTTLYFEDAIGNRDSVVIGFDTLATTGIDPQFGEVEITEPFDSIFEVRVGSMNSVDRLRTMKYDIEPSEPVYPISTSYGCHTGPRSFIYIWAKHQPVTVSWDNTAFLNDICVRGSLLSNHWADEVTGPYIWDFWLQNEYYCMAAQNSFTIDVSSQAITDAEVVQPVVIEKEVEGMGIQEIYGLRFFPSPTFTAWTPCYYITETTEIERIKQASIYPNPTSGVFKIQMLDGVKIIESQLYDGQGRLVFLYRYSDTFNVSTLPSGMYYLLLTGDNGKIYSTKIMKI